MLLLPDLNPDTYRVAVGANLWLWVQHPYGGSHRSETATNILHFQAHMMNPAWNKVESTLCSSSSSSSTMRKRRTFVPLIVANAQWQEPGFELVYQAHKQSHSQVRCMLQW